MQLCEINMPSFSKLKGTVKLCPLNDTEGQFFAMLEKDGAKEKTSLSFMKSTRDKTVEDFIRENLILNEYELYQYNGHFYLSLKKLPDLKNGILKCGIYLGDVVKKRFEPAHDLYRANSLKGKFRYTYDLNDDEYLTFISGNQLKADLEDHYYQITYRGHSLGYGKSGSGYIKNKYPKGLRRMI
jgi:NOL1/NOP2/fmu family ribosome biogenesis protein